MHTDYYKNTLYKLPSAQWNRVRKCKRNQEKQPEESWWNSLCLLYTNDTKQIPQSNYFSLALLFRSFSSALSISFWNNNCLSTLQYHRISQPFPSIPRATAPSHVFLLALSGHLWYRYGASTATPCKYHPTPFVLQACKCEWFLNNLM